MSSAHNQAEKTPKARQTRMPNYKPIFRGQTKTAGIKLSTDTSRWVDEIYEYLSKTHPYLADYLQGDIDWSEEAIDEDSASASGFVTVLLGERPIRIPIQVQNGELKPVDIYLDEQGKANGPINRLFVVQNMQQGPTVGDKIDPQLDQPSYNDGMVTKVGNYRKFAERAQKAMDLTVEDYPALRKAAGRVLMQVPNVSGPAYDTLLVEKGGSHYKLSAYSRGHLTESVLVDPATAFSHPQSKLAHACRNASEGAVIVAERELDRPPFVAGEARGQVKIGAASGVTSDGNLVTGYLVPTIGFRDGKALGGVPVVFAAPGAITTSTEGLSQAKTASVGLTKFATRVRQGDTGVFLEMDGETPIAATSPVKIGQVSTSLQGERVVRVQSEAEGSIKVVFSKLAQRLVGVSEGTCLMPATFRFLPAREVRLISDDAGYLQEKAASSGLSTCDLVDSGGVYRLRAGIGSENRSETDGPRTEIKATLMSLGCPGDAADTLMKSASEIPGRLVSFSGLDLPIREDRGQIDLSPVMQKRAEAIFRTWTDNRDAVLKFAAAVEEKGIKVPGKTDAASTLTGMNTMDPYNAVRFADAKEEISEAKQAVADVLYRIRKGEIKNVEEEVAKDALTALDKILSGLDNFLATKE